MSTEPDLQTGENSLLITADQTPQTVLAVESIDRQMPRYNLVALAETARLFDTSTTVETEPFSGSVVTLVMAGAGPDDLPACSVRRGSAWVRGNPAANAGPIRIPPRL